MKLAAVCVLAAALAAGCGSTNEVREPDLVIRGASPRPPDPGDGSEDRRITIAVVTHGQASSAFWTIVRLSLIHI